MINLKRATEEAGGRRRFWFSSLAEVIDENVLSANIWQIAADASLNFEGGVRLFAEVTTRMPVVPVSTSKL